MEATKSAKLWREGGVRERERYMERESERERERAFHFYAGASNGQGY